MKIEYGEPKRQQNLKEHGLDLADAVNFDWQHAVVRSTYPSRTGRLRFIAVGRFGRDLFAIVFSPLGTEAISVVSFRRASRRERRIYAQEEN